MPRDPKTSPAGPHHGWPAPEALLADHVALVARLNACPLVPPWGGGPEPSLSRRRSARSRVAGGVRFAATRERVNPAVT